MSTNNPTPHILSEGENAAPLEVIGCTATDSLVIVMVGLPASGKTHTARRIVRYLNFFLDIPSEIFNVATYRRELVGEARASFFDYSDKVSMKMRGQALDQALDDLIAYMNDDSKKGFRVAVLDSSNDTKTKRKAILEKLNSAGVGAKKLFIEVVCDEPDLVESNMRTVAKTSTTRNKYDYKGLDEETALQDLKERRAKYEMVYESVDESLHAYIKVLNYKMFEIYNVHGYLPGKIVNFVMNLHTQPRTFYFTRHGQSIYNQSGKIGGDSGLSKAGVEYARRLAKYAHEVIAKTAIEEGDESVLERNVVPARLWTSTLLRTIETAEFIEHPAVPHSLDSGLKLDWLQFRPMARRNLDEIYAGVCDGMTYKEIETQFPDEFERRQKDKLSYRYPRGESYMDVILRLDPLAHEMERSQEALLIIGHQGILRILYAYFMGLSRDDAPYVNIPLNTVIKLTPYADVCEEERICLMNKEEMLNDGQDEPITSMPIGPDTQARYALNDPIMNAPSH